MSKTEFSPQMSVMFVSKDVKAAIAYYRDQLGFQVDTTWPSEEKPMWASVSFNGQTIMLSCEATDVMECGADTKELWLSNSENFRKAPGGGVVTYFPVPDVDAYYKDITGRGAKACSAPMDQFYGIRDFPAKDMDGYILSFFQGITLTTCGSCGMPMQDAKEGQMYCEHCSDDKDNLHPYEAILEGTIQGYFMGMQKLERPAAEAAA